MSDEELLRLVSAAADGELDPRQQADLDRRLRDSATARRFREDLQRLETLFSSIPERPVPDTLHARIMAAAGAAIRRPASPTPSRTPAFSLRYGLAVAAGILLTVAVYEMQPVAPGAADYRSLSGTLAPDSRAAVRVLQRETTELAEVTGRLELQQRGNELLLEIHVDAAETVDLTVDFAAAGLSPVGIVQHRTPFEFIEITDRLLRARGAGRHEVSVSLRRADDAAAADEAAIKLEYSSNGRVLKQGSLSPPLKETGT